MVDENRGNNTRKTKLPRSRLFRVFFVSAMVLLALTILVVVIATLEGPIGVSGEYVMLYSSKLPEKPQTYFSLSNPDSYVLQALSNPGSAVQFRSFDETQIDELMGINGVRNFGSCNVEFGGSYYQVSVTTACVDYPAPLFLGSTFYPNLIMFWFMWVFCAAVALVAVRKKFI